MINRSWKLIKENCKKRTDENLEGKKVIGGKNHFAAELKDTTFLLRNVSIDIKSVYIVLKTSVQPQQNHSEIWILQQKECKGQWDKSSKLLHVIVDICTAMWLSTNRVNNTTGPLTTLWCDRLNFMVFGYYVQGPHLAYVLSKIYNSFLCFLRMLG